jgi:hypothetical protein
MVGNFLTGKTSVRKFTSTCGKNPYKISAKYFFAPKNLYLLAAKNLSIFGIFFVSRMTNQQALTRTADESEKPNRFAAFDFPNVFRFL